MQGKSGFSLPKHVAYFGGASLVALTWLAGSTVLLPEWTASKAQDGWSYYRQSDPYYYHPEMRRRPDVPPRPASRQPARPAKQAKQATKAPPPPPGPHLLVVSVKSQRIALYSNGKLIQESPVSTGKPTNPTPYGIFSVIQKNRHHRSNIYSDAPMPYMQRLTWSGIALHEGALPGRPASHGCIRLPEQFANFLWRTTRLGTRVVISREDTTPYDVTHAKLFQPKTTPATVETMPPLRRTLDATTPAFIQTVGMAVETNALGSRPDNDATKLAETEPKLILDAAASQTEGVSAKAEMLASLSPEQVDIPAPILDSFVQSLEAKQKKAPPSGPISVFISRKEKQLFVRQGFVPLFTAPVSFRDEKAIFGTHVLTAYNKGDDSKSLRWMAVTLPAELPHVEKPKTTFRIDQFGRRVEVPVKQKTKAEAKVHEPQAVPSITSVLDRIDIADDVVERIAEYMMAGASLIISDHGLGRETGLHTDFIVETR